MDPPAVHQEEVQNDPNLEQALYVNQPLNEQPTNPAQPSLEVRQLLYDHVTLSFKLHAEEDHCSPNASDGMNLESSLDKNNKISDNKTVLTGELTKGPKQIYVDNQSSEQPVIDRPTSDSSDSPVQPVVDKPTEEKTPQAPIAVELTAQSEGLEAHASIQSVVEKTAGVQNRDPEKGVETQQPVIEKPTSDSSDSPVLSVDSDTQTCETITEVSDAERLMAHVSDLPEEPVALESEQSEGLVVQACVQSVVDETAAVQKKDPKRRAKTHKVKQKINDNITGLSGQPTEKQKQMNVDKQSTEAPAIEKQKQTSDSDSPVLSVDKPTCEIITEVSDAEGLMAHVSDQPEGPVAQGSEQSEGLEAQVSVQAVVDETSGVQNRDPARRVETHEVKQEIIDNITVLSGKLTENQNQINVDKQSTEAPAIEKQTSDSDSPVLSVVDKPTSETITEVSVAKGLMAHVSDQPEGPVALESEQSEGLVVQTCVQSVVVETAAVRKKDPKRRAKTHKVKQKISDNITGLSGQLTEKQKQINVDKQSTEAPAIEKPTSDPSDSPVLSVNKPTCERRVETEEVKQVISGNITVIPGQLTKEQTQINVDNQSTEQPVIGKPNSESSASPVLCVVDKPTSETFKQKSEGGSTAQELEQSEGLEAQVSIQSVVEKSAGVHNRDPGRRVETQQPVIEKTTSDSSDSPVLSVDKPTCETITEVSDAEGLMAHVSDLAEGPVALESEQLEELEAQASVLSVVDETPGVQNRDPERRVENQEVKQEISDNITVLSGKLTENQNQINVDKQSTEAPAIEKQTSDLDSPVLSVVDTPTGEIIIEVSDAEGLMAHVSDLPEGLVAQRSEQSEGLEAQVSVQAVVDETAEVQNRDPEGRVPNEEVKQEISDSTVFTGQLTKVPNKIYVDNQSAEHPVIDKPTSDSSDSPVQPVVDKPTDEKTSQASITVELTAQLSEQSEELEAQASVQSIVEKTAGVQNRDPERRVETQQPVIEKPTSDSSDSPVLSVDKPTCETITEVSDVNRLMAHVSDLPEGPVAQGSEQSEGLEAQASVQYVVDETSGVQNRDPERRVVYQEVKQEISDNITVLTGQRTKVPKLLNVEKQSTEEPAIEKQASESSDSPMLSVVDKPTCETITEASDPGVSMAHVSDQPEITAVQSDGLAPASVQFVENKIAGGQNRDQGRRAETHEVKQEITDKITVLTGQLTKDQTEVNVDKQSTEQPVIADSDLPTSSFVDKTIDESMPEESDTGGSKWLEAQASAQSVVDKTAEALNRDPESRVETHEMKQALGRSPSKVVEEVIVNRDSSGSMLVPVVNGIIAGLVGILIYYFWRGPTQNSKFE